MSDKPKRRFWRIHLSTAIVQMFVAAGLLFANMTPRVEQRPHFLSLFEEQIPYLRGYGWPWVFFEHVALEGRECGTVDTDTALRTFAVNALIICATAILFESWSSHRSAKPEPLE